MRGGAVAPLQRAPGAAALKSRLHLLGVRGAVGAAEHHLPPAGLADAAADAGGRRRLARSGAVHARDLAGGRARPHGLVALQLLSHHLTLTCQVWSKGHEERVTDVVGKVIPPLRLLSLAGADPK